MSVNHLLHYSRQLRGIAACGGLLLLASPLAADHTQRTLTGIEEINFHERPEAWGMKNFAGVSLFSGFGPPKSMGAGSVDLALEVAHIPKLNRQERRLGFDGTKEEDTNKAPVMIRPRLTLGVTERISVTVSYVPPTKVFDVKTELAAISLNRPLIETGEFTLGVRAFAQYGKVEGDITCPEGRLHEDEFARHCVAGSSDTMRMRTYGAEIGTSYRLSRLRDLTPYLTFSYQTMTLDFNVDAEMPGGFHDQRTLTTRGETWAAGAGVTLSVSDRLDLSAGVVYMPNRVRRRDEDNRQMQRRNEPMINTRLQLTYAFR